MASMPEDNNRSDLRPLQQAMQAVCSSIQSPTMVTPLASAFPPIDATTFFTDRHHQDHCLVSDKFMVDRNEADLDSEDKKMPDNREHKKRSKNWTRAETLKLIKLRSELASRFARTGRKSELWDQIADGLQRDQFCRDAQQCRDKWEKLMAGYKEVKDGHKDREDNPFYEELHPLLSGKSIRKDKDQHFLSSHHDADILMHDASRDHENPKKESESKGPSMKSNGCANEDENAETRSFKRKRRPEEAEVQTIHSIRSLLETVISCQQNIFKDFLETLARKEEQRDQIREEREEKWRAEERAQNLIFNNAMLLLTQKLVEDKVGSGSGSGPGPANCNNPSTGDQHRHHLIIKRSKNWKRFEVLELIRCRAEMESMFLNPTHRSSAWDQLSDVLGAHGISRDGKQCQEKWEKLVSEYNEVLDGRKEQSESAYFHELTKAIGLKNRESIP